MVIARLIGVFAIVFVGFFACKVGWLPVKSSIYLSKIVLFIACPCVLFLAIARQEYSISGIHTMLMLIGTAVFFYVLSFIIGFLFCRIFRVRKEDRSMYVNFCTTPNNGFIGIPVGLALFGQPMLFLIALLNMVQAFFLYSYGTYLIRKGARFSGGRSSETGEKNRQSQQDVSDNNSTDSTGVVGKIIKNHFTNPHTESADSKLTGAQGATGDTSVRPNAKQILKDFLVPPVIGCLAGMAFYLLRIPVPGGIADVMDIVGATMTPLCMMFIGIQLTESSPRRLFANKRLIAATVFRLAIIPALFFVLLIPLRTGVLPVSVDSLFVCAMMINFMTPIGAALPPLAEMHGSNVKLASEGVFLSTLISMVTIPVAGIFLTSL